MRLSVHVVPHVYDINHDMDSLLPNSTSPLLLNAVNFVILRDNLMINPIFGLLSSKVILSMSNLVDISNSFWVNRD